MHLFGLLALLIAAFEPSSTAVTDNSGATENRPILWNDLRLGMTREEVKKLHPKNPYQIGNGCNIDVFPRFENKILNRVDLEWSTKDPPSLRCGTLVHQTLLDKYGTPQVTEREIKSKYCGNPYAGGLAGSLAQVCRGMGGNEPDYFELSRWTVDGIEITFKIDAKADDPNWWAVYRMAPVAGEQMKSAF